MALPLELGGIQDPDVRRAFEQISQQFPVQRQQLALRITTGAVTAAGGVDQAGTTGWTVNRTALGNYTLTFAPAYVVAPIVVLTFNAKTVVNGAVELTNTPTTAGFGVFAFATNTVAAQDSAWSFVAIGA